MTKIPFKPIVIGINLLAVLQAFFMTSDYGFPSYGDEDFWFAIIMTISPIITLTYLFTKKEMLSLRLPGGLLPDEEERKLRKELRMAEMKKKLDEMKK